MIYASYVSAGYSTVPNRPHITLHTFCLIHMQSDSLITVNCHGNLPAELKNYNQVIQTESQTKANMKLLQRWSWFPTGNHLISQKKP